MYGALWRLLPGPLWARVILAMLLAAITIGALMAWVFPWIADLLFVEQSTVG